MLAGNVIPPTVSPDDLETRAAARPEDLRHGLRGVVWFPAVALGVAYTLNLTASMPFARTLPDVIQKPLPLIAGSIVAGYLASLYEHHRIEDPALREKITRRQVALEYGFVTCVAALGYGMTMLAQSGLLDRF